MFGVAKSEHPRLTNGETIFEEFQPMWSQSTNVTDRQTDGRTDRQTTCDRNTALCTKVHRAVKTAVLCVCSFDYRFFARLQRVLEVGKFTWPQTIVLLNATLRFGIVVVALLQSRNRLRLRRSRCEDLSRCSVCGLVKTIESNVERRRRQNAAKCTDRQRNTSLGK